MISERIITVKQIVEVPIEVIKIQEVIKEVERIVYQSRGGNGSGGGGGAGAGGGYESDCDCLTSARLQSIWNKLFKLTGPTSSECLTEEQFVGMISKSFKKNCLTLESENPARDSMDTKEFARTTNSSGFGSTAYTTTINQTGN